MANAMGGGGGATGFKHLLEHLGPAVRFWTEDMRKHDFVWSPENMDAITNSVISELGDKDIKALEHQRDQLTIKIVKLTQERMKLSVK